MALQDNFNILLNKTEQNKQQRELQKQQDKTFEIQLQEELQKAIETYTEEHNKSDLYLLATECLQNPGLFSFISTTVK